MLRRKFSIPAVINVWAMVAFIPVDGRMALTIVNFIVQVIKKWNSSVRLFPRYFASWRLTSNPFKIWTKLPGMLQRGFL